MSSLTTKLIRFRMTFGYLKTFRPFRNSGGNTRMAVLTSIPTADLKKCFDRCGGKKNVGLSVYVTLNEPVSKKIDR